MNCPSKRCDGLLRMDAEGVDAKGRGVRWSTCQKCGRLVEEELPTVPADHPQLDLGGDAA